MNLGIIGSRKFTNYKFAEDTLDSLVSENGWDVKSIVSGKARGADTIGADWGKARGITVVEFLPDWSLGRGAGMARNTTIVENIDVLVAFWDMASKGTKDSITKARKLGKEVIVIDCAEVIGKDEAKVNEAASRREYLLNLAKKSKA